MSQRLKRWKGSVKHNNSFRGRLPKPIGVRNMGSAIEILIKALNEELEKQKNEKNQISV